MSDFKYVSRFGIIYLTDLMLLKLGVKKKQSNLALLQKQKYFEKMSPDEYENELKNWFYKESGRKLDLENPQTFTEKIQWLKLHDSTNEKTILADKYLVREWIARKIGEKYLIPLIGVWDKAEDIEYDKLPRQFVLKCNHGCAMNIIIKDKEKANQGAINRQLNGWLKINYAFVTGDFQLHYKDIQPRIIAEQFMSNANGEDLCDYKFFCFNGEPKYCQVINDRSVGETIDFYDMNWNHQDFVGLAPCPNSPKGCEKPRTFDEMKKLAKVLAAGFKFVRVDFYEINGAVYFGEMTFTPGGGSGRFNPESADLMLGKMIKL